MSHKTLMSTGQGCHSVGSSGSNGSHKLTTTSLTIIINIFIYFVLYVQYNIIKAKWKKEITHTLTSQKLLVSRNLTTTLFQSACTSSTERYIWLLSACYQGHCHDRVPSYQMHRSIRRSLATSSHNYSRASSISLHFCHFAHITTAFLRFTLQCTV